MKLRIPALQSGFSMIELSVATAVLSMGLSGVSLMMLAAVQGTDEAHHQTVAAAQAHSLAELIAMNTDAVGHFVNPPGSGTASCFESNCEIEALVSGALHQWRAGLGADLPLGTGLVCRDSTTNDGDLLDASCDGAGPAVIKVFWRESRHPDRGDDGMRRFITRLPW